MGDRRLLLVGQLIVGFVLGDLIDETWVIPLDRRPREETIAHRALDIVLEASHHGQRLPLAPHLYTPVVEKSLEEIIVAKRIGGSLYLGVLPSRVRCFSRVSRSVLDVASSPLRAAASEAIR